MNQFKKIDCDHLYHFGGVKFKLSQTSTPAGGLVQRIYYEHYYCQKCLTDLIVKVAQYEDCSGPPSFNATPLRTSGQLAEPVA